MSKTLNFTPTTACWYSCNFSQPLLSVLWGANSDSGLDMKGFRYTLDEQGTDIDDIFIKVSVSNLRDEGGIVGGGDQFVILGLSGGYNYDNNLLPNADRIIDVAFGYVPNETTKGALTLESNDVYGDYDGLSIIGYDDGGFYAVMKLDDDTIIGPFECRKYIRSTYAHSQTGDPVFFSRGGQDIDYAWDMGTNNGGYHIETPYLTKSQTTSFTFSHKVYETIDNAINHLKYGIEDGALGQEESDSEDLTDTVLYYYDTMECYNDLGMTDLVETFHKQIIVRGEDVPLNLERTLVTYSVNNNGLVDFHVANGGDQYLSNVKINGVVELDKNDNLPHNLTYYITQFDTCGFGMYYDPIRELYVKNTIKTNMRGIGANGDLIPPESIIGEGDEMLGNSNTADYDVGLSECWLLSKESVQSLGKKFNTTVDRSQDNSSAYVVGDWILGLGAYPNPLDVICDLFYLPISVDDFVNTTQGSFTFSPIETGEN